MTNRKITPFNAGDNLQQHHIDFLTNVMGVGKPIANNLPIWQQKKLDITKPLTSSAAQKLNSIVDNQTLAMAQVSGKGVPIKGPCDGCPNCNEWEVGVDTWHSCN